MSTFKSETGFWSDVCQHVFLEPKNVIGYGGSLISQKPSKPGYM